MRAAALTVCVLLVIAAAQASHVSAQRPMNQLTDQERAQGWRLLFDGRTTNGWRGFQRDTMPSGWQVVDGLLTRVARARDIVTTEQFANFELSLEWRVEEGGNSGVMYRVSEAAELTYHSGPEMQILDDEHHRDGQSPLTSAGSMYGLYPATRGVVKKFGEWNESRVVLNGNHVEHWLNGVKLFEAEIGSPDWNQRVQNSKFAAWPGFAKEKRGHIALQEHGSLVAYRNIKIRVLP